MASTSRSLLCEYVVRLPFYTKPSRNALTRCACTLASPARPRSRSSTRAPKTSRRPGPNRVLQPPSRRRYHSTTHPPPPGPFNPTERVLLAAAYSHVPQHGFSLEALALGARDAGYLNTSINLLPDGTFSLILWHLLTKREAVATRAAELFPEGNAVPVRDRIEVLTWERLLGNVEVIRRWQDALAVMAQPTYMPTCLEELARLADELWFQAGDRAVDPTWYAKRAALATIYAASELHMTNDRSPGFQDTRAFLRRRLQETDELGASVRSLGEWAGFTASAGVNVLRSKGVPI